MPGTVGLADGAFRTCSAIYPRLRSSWQENCKQTGTRRNGCGRDLPLGGTACATVRIAVTNTVAAAIANRPAEMVATFHRAGRLIPPSNKCVAGLDHERVSVQKAIDLNGSG